MLRCSHECSAAFPPERAFLLPLRETQGVALPQSLHTLASHDAGSVYYLMLMFSMIKFPLGAGTEPCSINKKCEQRCHLRVPLLPTIPQLFSHASSPHINTIHPSLSVPWSHIVNFSHFQETTLSGRNRHSPLNCST